MRRRGRDGGDAVKRLWNRMLGRTEIDPPLVCGQCGRKRAWLAGWELRCAVIKHRLRCYRCGGSIAVDCSQNGATR